MAGDSGPQGGHCSSRGESDGREIDDVDSTRGKKKSHRENGVLSTTIKTNLRQIALERDGGFFERNARRRRYFRSGASTRRCPRRVRPTCCLRDANKLYQFPAQNPLLFLCAIRPPARLVVRGLSARADFIILRARMQLL